jgi:ankyrin repeat protein
MQLAAMIGDNIIINNLIADPKINLNIRSKDSDPTPLHYTVIFGHRLAYSTLIEHGANQSLKAQYTASLQGTPKEMGEHIKSTKKSFRYLNRVSFIRDDLPFRIDLSIVKSSTRQNGQLLKTYNTSESNVFNNNETYEIEIETNQHDI